MARKQCKNIFNSIKKMTLPEPSGSIIARPKLLNTDEAEENNIKNSFMKIIEAI